MADTEKPAVRPGKKKKIVIALVALVVLGAGGVGAGLYASGATHADAAPDRPKLVLREGVPASEAQRYASPKGDKSPDPTKFKASYYPIKDSFTSNLRDSEGFVQVAIGVSTYYDDRVIQNIALHEMAVRSAVLMTLSDQDTLAMTTPQGKTALKASLKRAINDVLEAKEGFGGVDDVYFTSFVIQ